LTNYRNVDGTNIYGYLGGTETPQLNKDFTTWTEGAISDFNGKANTAIIAEASSDARDMCSVLNTFNASDNYNDWYVPACGQLALMYLNMTEINEALTKIGGTTLNDSRLYWSSSEEYSTSAWFVSFYDGEVGVIGKNMIGREVRFIRDISVKPLKERVSDLESNKADKILIINHDTNDVVCNLTPNVYHKWGTVTSLSLTLADASEDECNEYIFEFISGDTATTLSLPATIKWAKTPSI
jgi:hypothetical protein